MAQAAAGSVLGLVTYPAFARTLASMGTGTSTRLWDPNSRLTPWALLDLERIAWIAEMRAGDLTDDERRVLRDVAARLQRVAELSAE